MLKYFNSQALEWELSRDFIKNRTVTGLFPQYFRVKETDFGLREYREARGTDGASGVGWG